MDVVYNVLAKNGVKILIGIGKILRKAFLDLLPAIAFFGAFFHEHLAEATHVESHIFQNFWGKPAIWARDAQDAMLC